ncbi:hypothetical protein EDB89DRAFT_66870 [Lactarius sanguifluus]|nr:hypothetical protein EDB89DRAFT_66870 [Lactarius sanguifluus]
MMVNGVRKCYSSSRPDVSVASSSNLQLQQRIPHARISRRKLTALLAQHATELVVLERIYYRHRAALFWAAVEARRRNTTLFPSPKFGMSSLVNDLRRSFYSDQPDAREPGRTTLPHHLSICFFERLRTCIALPDKARRSLHLRKHCTQTCVRIGAFLHLVVTLTTLVARLAHLSSALRYVLSALHAESICLLDTLHVRTIPARKSHAQGDTTATSRPPLYGDDAEVPSASLVSTGRVASDSDLDVSVTYGARSPLTNTQREGHGACTPWSAGLYRHPWLSTGPPRTQSW